MIATRQHASSPPDECNSLAGSSWMSGTGDFDVAEAPQLVMFPLCTCPLFRPLWPQIELSSGLFWSVQVALSL